MMRDSRSRPNSSVPSRWAAEGGCKAVQVLDVIGVGRQQRREDRAEDEQDQPRPGNRTRRPAKGLAEEAQSARYSGAVQWQSS